MTQHSLRHDTRRWYTCIAFMDIWGPDRLEHVLETMGSVTLESQNVEILVPPNQRIPFPQAIFVQRHGQ